MSADNWAPCPRCHSRMVAGLSEKRKKVEASYGKVSAAEYARLLEVVEKALRQQETPQTFREDYEIGLAGAEFYVSYSGCCTVCKLKFTFKTEEVIPGVIE